MRAVVQRVTEACVTVDDQVVGAIKKGLLVLVGIARNDRPSDAAYLANKIAKLRIFSDERGRFASSVLEAGGAVLLVSQFTLYGDCRRGRRPSFDRVAAPEDALVVYEALVRALREHGVTVMTGTFRAHMVVASVNDGPVTMLLDDKKAF